MRQRRAGWRGAARGARRWEERHVRQAAEAISAQTKSRDGGRGTSSSPSEAKPTGSESKNGVEAHVYEANEQWRRWSWSTEDPPPTPRQAYERLADCEAKLIDHGHRFGQLQRHSATLTPLRMRQHKRMLRPMTVDVALPSNHPLAQEELSSDRSCAQEQAATANKSGYAELEERFQHATKGWPCIIALPSEPGCARHLGCGLDELLRNRVFELSGGTICASVSTNTFSWFVDGPWAQHESYFTQVVVDHLRSHYNATTFHLVGMQTGGWAAMSLLTRFPGLFASVTAFDAPLALEQISFSMPGMLENVGSDVNMCKHTLASNLSDQFVIDRLRRTESGGPACAPTGRIMLVNGPSFPEQSRDVSRLLTKLGIRHRHESSTRGYEPHWHSGWMRFGMPQLRRALVHHHELEGRLRHSERVPGDEVETEDGDDGLQVEERLGLGISDSSDLDPLGSGAADDAADRLEPFGAGLRESPIASPTEAEDEHDARDELEEEDEDDVHFDEDDT